MHMKEETELKYLKEKEQNLNMQLTELKRVKMYIFLPFRYYSGI